MSSYIDKGLRMAAAAGLAIALRGNALPLNAQGCPESVCVYPQYPNDIVRPDTENIYWDPQWTFQEQDGTKVLHPVYLAMVKLYSNKVYDLRNVQVPPSGLTITYDYTIMDSDSRLLPASESPTIPLSKIGYNLGINSGNSPIKVEAPEGSRVVFVDRWDKIGMEAPTASRKWLWLPEGATLTNTRTGASSTYEGSFALPLGWRNLDKSGNVVSEVELARIEFPQASA
ncbi:MAG: hypothetical protein Q7S79_02270 [bacterium]|nr:hypothetical protein [bacterium]